ncbi:MAG: hypothetical protein CL926_01395 [Deltaproteobacteria bacterium]|nr:hypothetical protein [Deltaproteobacteria bacterium]
MVQINIRFLPIGAFGNICLIAVLSVDFLVNFGIDITSQIGERKNEKISGIIRCYIGAFCM